MYEGGLAQRNGAIVVQVTGPDAEDYLHRRLSQRAKGLAVGEGHYATLLEGNGKMRAAFAISRLDSQSFLLTAPAVVADTIEADLSRFVIMEDLAIEVLGPPTFGSCLVVGVAGVAALARVPALADVDLTRCDAGVVRTGGSLKLIAHPFGDVAAWWLVGPADEVTNLCDNWIAKAELRELSDAQFDDLRLATATPWFGRDAGFDTVPFEARMHAHVDLTKGCFPGQEVLAKMENLGHPARRLSLIEAQSEGALRVCCEVRLKDQIVGTVTTVDSDHRRAFAMLRWAQHHEGMELQADGVAVRVVAWPTGSG